MLPFLFFSNSYQFQQFLFTTSSCMSTLESGPMCAKTYDILRYYRHRALAFGVFTQVVQSDNLREQYCCYRVPPVHHRASQHIYLINQSLAPQIISVCV
jgi:hypothetical protein